MQSQQSSSLTPVMGSLNLGLSSHKKLLVSDVMNENDPEQERLPRPQVLDMTD